MAYAGCEPDPVIAALEPERLKSPQRLRKASQTARGFNGWGLTLVHLHGVRQELSAKADITGSEPRIHSPGLGRCDYRV